MSCEAMAWAIDREVGSPTDKLVLVALSDSCDPQNFTLGQMSSLRRWTGCPDDEIRGALGRLAMAGLIVAARGGPGGQERGFILEVSQ